MFLDEVELRYARRQDEHEDEPEDESFRSFWMKPVINEPDLMGCSCAKAKTKTNPETKVLVRSG